MKMKNKFKSVSYDIKDGILRQGLTNIYNSPFRGFGLHNKVNIHILSDMSSMTIHKYNDSIRNPIKWKTDDAVRNTLDTKK